MAVRLELVAVSPGGARAGVLHTRAGNVLTPVFMPVATHASFRHLGVDDAEAAGAPIMLCNTYHLLLRPGIELFRALGGVHRFMNRHGPVLTDSGGFQIFSVPDAPVITEQGAAFRSHHDNARHVLTPESSVQMQQAIGSDIMMVLDVCTDARLDAGATRAGMERTHRWAERSLAEHTRQSTGQALFGIVQGGVHPALRDESAAFLRTLPMDGYAIGGLAVGETRAEREGMTAHVTAQLPVDKPRYLMGVGTPVDVLEAVARGVDMFDCILPTKMAQQGYAYTMDGLVRLQRAEHRLAETPLDRSCGCATCRGHSRAYLHHVVRLGLPAAVRLLAIHNLRHYADLLADARAAIVDGTFESFAATRLARMDRARRATPPRP